MGSVINIKYAINIANIMALLSVVVVIIISGSSTMDGYVTPRLTVKIMIMMMMMMMM